MSSSIKNNDSKYDSDNESIISDCQEIDLLADFIGNSTSINGNTNKTLKQAYVEGKVSDKCNIISQIHDIDTDSSRSSNIMNTTTTKRINKNTNKSRYTGIMSEFQGLEPIWNKITNKSKTEHSSNNYQQYISPNYANLLEYVLSCGSQFSSVINNESNVLISMIASKKTIFSCEIYLFVLVKENNQNKILYKFSKNTKMPIQMYLLDNQVKVLCKDSLTFSKDIVYKIQIYSLNRNIVIKFNNSDERNKWIQLLT